MAVEQGPLLENPEENPKERVDRELGELLQGLRVAATGVQVLFAFLLTLPFSSGFGKIDSAGKWLYYVALVAAATASICLIAPTTQHRIMFRSGLKEIVLHRANELALAGGIAIAVSMTCSTALAVEVFLGTWPAAFLAGGIALLSSWLWFLLPLITLRRHQG
ncbi:hypothetical protein Acor_63440 [Acrocarpospora corrugata]|uniref:Integral membrane protein n=1 Tax=Acrocarpospora corrugata TaxID=35763 RepID=A0A5M3W671_9ACTN|nr:DUF6328 family protein [Acrocarpospora corrugata]GES04276.1 hypothetical protein Acor_63440 [Acrocarpospora corrugata]